MKLEGECSRTERCVLREVELLRRKGVERADRAVPDLAADRRRTSWRPHHESLDGLRVPVFKYSSAFDFIWEELTVPVAHRADWHAAEHIIGEKARRVSDSKGARQAIAEMAQRYPVPHAEVEPRVFARATDNYMELSARFVVPVRTARTAKDDMTRRVVERLAKAGIEVASATEEVTVHRADGETPTLGQQESPG